MLSHSTQSSAGDIQTIKQRSTYNDPVNSNTLHTPLTNVSVSTGYRHPQYTFPFLNGIERSKLQSLLLNQGWMDLRSAETMNIGLQRIKSDSEIRFRMITSRQPNQFKRSLENTYSTQIFANRLMTKTWLRKYQFH